MSQTFNEDLVGTYLNDRYRIDLALGQGSMGVVYRANDTLLGREVAIKVLSSFSPGTSDATRLYQEAQSAAKLNHPNIVTVYDVGDHDGLPFIVMELVGGSSLHEERPDDLDTILGVFGEICSALQHAHANGIIHRDVKPENVLIDNRGNAKLMDFGIARSAASRMTQQGVFIGTIHYIAPEQALGGEIDHRADLYSLGVMMYEFVTGRLPFQAEEPLAVITQHLRAPVVPPRALDESITPELDRLIQQLLAKNPVDRPGSAADVLEILDSIREDTKKPVAEASQPGEISDLDRIASGRIVGRSIELKRARALWQQAVAGRGQLLLVSGEPGVGKTRLVQELVTQTQVARGNAFVGASFAEWGPPYDPFRQIILQVKRESNLDFEELPHDFLRDLVRIAPELGLELPALPEVPSDEPPSEADSLLNSMLFFFNLLCSHAPVLLVLEDVHWADRSSLVLLRQLAREMRRSKLLIVATYREVELHEAQYLHEVLLDFNREKLGTRLKLNRLDHRETQDLLAFLFTDEITPEFLEGIYHETEGNPFFVEEVCKALLESGKLVYRNGRWHRPDIDELGIPQSIQIAIQTRLKVLPKDSQAVLEQAAVLGREFDYKTLQQAVELGENTLIDALEDALSARLIGENGDHHGGEFAFVHALIPGTLMGSLRTLKRRKLHLRAAKAIESIHPGSFEVLAYQFIEAGQVDNGVTYLILAGDRARDLYAYEDAIRNYQQAADHLKEEGEPQDAARIMMKLGLAFHNTFQYKDSRQAYQEGFKYWQQAGILKKGERLRSAPHALRSVIGEPISLDPGLNDDGWSHHIIDNIFSGLGELDPEFDIVPDIAHRWEVLEDGRRYLFHLRDNVTWTDGVPVTAHDFEFAWKRVLDPETGSDKANHLYPIKNAKNFHQRLIQDPNEVGISARDDLTLEVELERPYSAFLYILSDAVSFPVPRHIVQECSADWTDLEHLVSNGPFKIKEWKQGESIELEVDRSYHQEFNGNVSQVLMNFFQKGIEDYLSAYQFNRLDILWTGWTSEFVRARFQFAEEFRTGPILMTYYISFDTRRKPFDDPRVRRALAHGLDRERLVNAVYEGRYFPATGGLLPPGMLGHLEGISLPFDPLLAQRLLSEAGYPGGSGFPEVEFLLSSSPHAEKIKENIHVQWHENLGITLEWNFVPWEEFVKRVSGQKPHLFGQGTIASYPDPEEFLNPSFISRLSGWINADYEGLVNRARETLDPQKRDELYRRADRMVVEQSPILPFGYSRFNVLIKPWVTRFPISPSRGWFLKDVIIEEH